MKVLHISSETGWRGGEQQIAYLLEELQLHGVENKVICRPGTAFEQYCKSSQTACYTLPLKNSLDVYSAWKIRKICRAEQATLVHVHSSRGHALMHLAQLMGSPTPYLLTRRVAFPIKSKGLNVLRYNSTRLRKIICISKAVLQSTAPVVENKEKLTVIYDGIDLKRFNTHLGGNNLRAELQLEAQTPLIGTVAALTSEKDLSTFIHAAKAISDSLAAAHFVIAGSGPELPALTALRNTLGLSEKLHFLGKRQDIPSLLPQLDLFMLSSRMEGLGTSILDAFACRVAVAATAAGGIPEVVQNQQTGLTAPVGDSEALATAALTILQNEGLRHCFIQQAHALLMKQFTKAHMSTETLRIYQEVLKTH